MDIFNITEDKVLQFRKDLSMELMELSEKEREKTVERRNEHQSSRHGAGTRNTSNDGTAASREDPVDEKNEGIGEDEGREDSPVSSGSNTSKNEDDQEKAKEGTSNTSNDVTAASREDSVDEEDEDGEDLPVSSGSNTEKNEEDQTKAKEGGNHSSNTTKKPKKMARRKRKQHAIGKSTTVKTPTEMRGRRKMPSRTAITFVVDKPLFREESEMLCQHIQEKHNNEVVFTVGGTVMTGAELVKCRDDAESSLNIVDAFIECLKCDDKKNGFEKNRIILQLQHQLKTPIQPRSLSDSCSSSAGHGEARKKRKVCLAFLHLATHSFIPRLGDHVAVPLALVHLVRAQPL